MIANKALVAQIITLLYGNQYYKAKRLLTIFAVHWGIMPDFKSGAMAIMVDIKFISMSAKKAAALNLKLGAILCIDTKG